MKIYELKKDVYVTDSLYKKRENGFYEANKELIDTLRKKGYAAFKYDDNFFILKKQERDCSNACDQCEFRRKDNYLYCDEFAMCLEHYFRSFNVSIRKAEEYEVTFGDDDNDNN